MLNYEIIDGLISGALKVKGKYRFFINYTATGDYYWSINTKSGDSHNLEKAIIFIRQNNCKEYVCYQKLNNLSPQKVREILIETVKL
ncbi:MAG: hypothetical protein EKK57_07330 [Proteobacteria bacterium]|nr:MAG: hypothetical protein EKK57_07330 [Pseudomonadota bacterium]